MSNSIFYWGLFGGVAIEIVPMTKLLIQGHRLPRKYTEVMFWVIHIAMAVIGGFLAVAHGVSKPILAVHIGASAPLIIEAMVRPRQ